MTTQTQFKRWTEEQLLTVNALSQTAAGAILLALVDGDRAKVIAAVDGELGRR